MTEEVKLYTRADVNAKNEANGANEDDQVSATYFTRFRWRR